MQPWRSILAHHMASSSGAWTPPSGLAAWYYGDSLTDTKWTDRSGNGKHLAITGDNPSANGITGPSYASDAAFAPPASPTICYWLYTANGTTQNVGAFHLGGAASGYLKLSAFWSSSTIVYADWRNESAGRMYYQFPSGDVGAWVHIAIVASSSGRTLYRNGTAVATNTTAVDVAPSAGLEVGRAKFGTTYFTLRTGSHMDDAMVFNSQLTPEQLQDIIANSPGSHAP